MMGYCSTRDHRGLMFPGKKSSMLGSIRDTGSNASSETGVFFEY
jgi:hypothetical protein